MDILMDWVHLMKCGGKLEKGKKGKRWKRWAVLTALTAFLAAGTLGCSAKDEVPEDKVNDLDFTVVGEDQQPDSLKDIIAEKYADAFQISYTLGEDLYIAVGYGEQPSGGYSISVNAFYETEDTVVIDTTLIGPGKAENVTKTPTRPYIVVKTRNIADKMIEFK